VPHQAASPPSGGLVPDTLVPLGDQAGAQVTYRCFYCKNRDAPTAEELLSPSVLTSKNQKPSSFKQRIDSVF